MAYSENQQAAMSNARAAQSKQDAKTPFLIHQKDGRLMPNTPLLRKHKDYRPFTGSVKASHEERMLFLATGSTRSRVINSAPEDEEDLPPFDIGKATKDEMVAFAYTEFGAVLDPTKAIRDLRREVQALAAPKPSALNQAEGLS